MPNPPTLSLFERAVLVKMHDEGLDGYAAQAEVMAEIRAVVSIMSERMKEWLQESPIAIAALGKVSP